MNARNCGLLLLLFFSVQCGAGEMVVRSFSAGATQGERVLEHVTEKAVVAEFLDPMDTGIGKSLAALLWRETLTAISDQAGAGVILARAPEGENLVSLIEQDYHRAALRIAAFQQARIALWGAAIEQQGRVFIDCHLSLVADTRSQLIAYKLDNRATDQQSSGTVSIAMPRTKFNFPTLELRRQDLFRRSLMTRGTVSVYAEANTDAAVLARVQGSMPLQAVDMQGDWFKVRMDEGGNGFVRGSQVDVPPVRVRIDRRAINLRASPTTNGDNIVINTDVDATLPVLQQRYIEGQGLWYQVPLAQQQVWIAAFLTEPVFSLPAVHFLAGMYRYYGARYKDARREFQRFIDFTGVDNSNVNLSMAYQYQALSRLLQGDSTESVVENLQRAVAQTPYDATPYQIEALAYLGQRHWRDQLERSLQRAVELDPRQQAAGQFVPLLRRQLQLLDARMPR